MKVIAVFAAVLAVSSAQFIYNGGYPYAHAGYAHAGFAHHGLGYSAVAAAPIVSSPIVAAPIVSAATKTQYHSQNELGEAAFGHSEPTQGHAAVRDAAGGVRGVFSYISPEGIPFTTHYTADHNGYRVASNALPVAPSVSIAGPVDTLEVHNAKVQHAAAHAEARSRGKRGVVSPLVSTYAAAPAFGYSTVAAAPAIGYTSAVVARPAASWGYSTVQHAAPVAQHVTYAATPVAHHAIAGQHVTYAAAPVHHAIAAPHHAVTYSAAVAPASTVIAAPAVRAATLTRVVNTPGHAVSYRVD